MKPPAELLRPSEIDDLLRSALLDWAAVLLLWLALALLPGWSAPLWIVLLAGRFHAFGVLLHEVCHLPLRVFPQEKAWKIKLLEALVGYPVASTRAAMRDHHLRHHRHNGLPGDPYFKRGVKQSRLIFVAMWLRSALLLPFWSLRPFFGLAALALPRLRGPYARIFLQDRSDRATDPALMDCLRAEPGQALFALGIVVLACFFPGPLGWGYLVPAELAGLLAGLRLLLEHDYAVAADRRFETILTTTCDHHLGPLGQLLLAPHHVGHHVVHHLHPQASHRHLPALRTWYATQHPEHYPALRRRLFMHPSAPQPTQVPARPSTPQELQGGCGGKGLSKGSRPKCTRLW